MYSQVAEDLWGQCFLRLVSMRFLVGITSQDAPMLAASTCLNSGRCRFKATLTQAPKVLGLVRAGKEERRHEIGQEHYVGLRCADVLICAKFPGPKYT